MAHDGQDLALTDGILLPDLLSLTKAAIGPVEEILEAGKSRVRAMVEENGRVSGALIEANQTAAHGLAWLATYAESLRQMQALGRPAGRERQVRRGRAADPPDRLRRIPRQIVGGIPMSQGEILRLSRYGPGPHEVAAVLDHRRDRAADAARQHARPRAPGLSS